MPPIIVHDEDFRLGPVNLWVYEKVKASVSTALGTATDQDLTFRARIPGVGGNSITVEYLDPATPGATLSVSVDGTDISVHLATNSASPPVITSTAAEVRDALNASAQVRSLMYAVLAAGNDGTGVAEAMSPLSLAGGSDTETERFVGALSEETTVNVSVTAVPMTAHLTGTQPRDKVGSGGTFQIKAGLKEMTLENFAFAFPGAELIEGAGGAQRLDFIVPTGKSFRQFGVKMQLRRLLSADAETTDPNEILTVPLCSPVDAEVSLKYNVTAQQMLEATFEAWPVNGRTAFFGTEVL